MAHRLGPTPAQKHDGRRWWRSCTRFWSDPEAADVALAAFLCGTGPPHRDRRGLVADSKAAIEVMRLGVPALVVELPNNLSPFVEAGVMAGAQTPAQVEPALRTLLYDREMRQRVVAAQGAFMRRYRIDADGGSLNEPPTPSFRF